MTPTIAGYGNSHSSTNFVLNFHTNANITFNIYETFLCYKLVLIYNSLKMKKVKTPSETIKFCSQGVLKVDYYKRFIRDEKKYNIKFFFRIWLCVYWNIKILYFATVLWNLRFMNVSTKTNNKKKLEKNTLELILGIKYITLRDERKQRFVAI